MSGCNNEKWNRMSAALLHKNTLPTTARNTLLRKYKEEEKNEIHIKQLKYRNGT